MSKYFVPINLTSYEILTPHVTRSEVDEGLRSMMEWLKQEQNNYYKNKFPQLIESLLDGEIELRGSLNSLGRKLGIDVSSKASYQPYNMSEMFRVSVLSKASLYLQEETLLSLITSLSDNVEELDPKKVREEYKKSYPSLKAPTQEFVKRTLLRLHKGVIHGVPSGDGVLPLWASDTHYSKLSRDGNKVFLTLPVMGLNKKVTLLFSLPKSERFQGVKVTRPNVYVNRKNGVSFGFTIQKPLPHMREHESVMGVDLGKVEPFVGTVFWGGKYSSPVMPTRTSNRISQKLNRLASHSKSLYMKEMFNKEKGHEQKSETLRVERLRVRSKMSRLKIEQSHRIATKIVQIAEQYNALIVLEYLSWVPHGKWDHSRSQEAIEHKARIRGIRTRKISPRNTSKDCPRCGSKVKHSGRATHCVKCVRVLDRDILASRNIAQRAYPTSFNMLSQLSLHTRVMRPVTPGSPHDYAPVIRNTT